MSTTAIVGPVTVIAISRDGIQMSAKVLDTGTGTQTDDQVYSCGFVIGRIGMKIDGTGIVGTDYDSDPDNSSTPSINFSINCPTQPHNNDCGFGIPTAGFGEPYTLYPGGQHIFVRAYAANIVDTVRGLGPISEIVVPDGLISLTHASDPAPSQMWQYTGQPASEWPPEVRARLTGRFPPTIMGENGIQQIHVGDWFALQQGGSAKIVSDATVAASYS